MHQERLFHGFLLVPLHAWLFGSVEYLHVVLGFYLEAVILGIFVVQRLCDAVVVKASKSSVLYQLDVAVVAKAS